MACKCCHGDDMLHYQNANNLACIDSKGEMLVIVNGTKMTFNVERCPRCGHMFTSYLNLRKGDDIWYADEEENIVEHGIVDSVLIKDEKVESFAVNFDNGDFDVFNGSGLGVHYFMDEMSAKDALARPQQDFEKTEMLFAGDTIYYVDPDDEEYRAEKAKVQHVGMINGSIEWFVAKFDNGDTEEFGPTAFGQFCFKKEADAKKAWDNAHNKEA